MIDECRQCGNVLDARGFCPHCNPVRSPLVCQVASGLRTQRPNPQRRRRNRRVLAREIARAEQEKLRLGFVSSPLNVAEDTSAAAESFGSAGLGGESRRQHSAAAFVV